MNDYIYHVSPYHRKLIEKAISICDDLNVPIADSYTFDYCHGCSYVGQCLQNTKTIVIDGRLQEREFIETALHELLHTIDNKKYSPHNGPWKKWAKYISENSDYSVTVRYYSHFSRKCNVPQNKELQGKPADERHRCIQDYLRAGRFSLETLLSYLPLADRADTREIVETILMNFTFDYDLALYLAGPIRSDKQLADQLMQNYCAGKYEKTISTMEIRIHFDSLFSFTDEYLTVSAYTDQCLGLVGSGQGGLTERDKEI